jgi:hypothetical protein
MLESASPAPSSGSAYSLTSVTDCSGWQIAAGSFSARGTQFLG